MKKTLSYILISLIIIVNLFAPFSVVFDGKNNIKINKNNSEAILNVSSASETTLNQNDKDLLKSVHNDCLASALADGQDKILCSQARFAINDGNLFIIIYLLGKDENGVDDYKISVDIKNSDGTNFKSFSYERNKDPKPFSITQITKEDGKPIKSNISDAIYEGYYFITTPSITGLIEGNTYSANIVVTKVETNTLTEDKVTGTNNLSLVEIKYDKKNQNVVGGISNTSIATGDEILPSCSFNPFQDGSGGTFAGCIAQGLYYVLFIPTSALFGLAGMFFDYTFAYSVQDTSYRSPFVVQGWGLMRDFCNMFFIFILLYIAIGTILGLHSVKTKEMIVNVVIIGLFINFSLFAAQVIIDASNIMAKVFYNSNTIVINIKDPTTGQYIPKENTNGVISISEAIVSKINPQKLIIDAKKINIVDKGQQGSANGLSNSVIILVIILSSIVNIVGMLIFLSVGIMFVSRVIGLWLAMIVSPIVFLTYAIPSLQNTDFVGWKKWWPETIKLAFLAPVFIFFMYLIVKFLELKFINVNVNQDGLTFILSVLLPFAFIIILMKKAQGIAKDMSGSIGQQITGMVSTVGGIALGAATGGVAMLGRGTLGAIGGKIANSSTLAKAEAKGGLMGVGAKMLLKSGDKLHSGSFDIRATKAGKSFAKETGLGSGMAMVGVNKGGNKAETENLLATRTERAERLKKIVEIGAEKDKRKAEVSKKILEDKNSQDLQKTDNELTIQRQKLQDTTDVKERDKISEEIRKLNAKKNSIVSGKNIGGENEDGTNKYNTDNGRISESVHKEIIEKETKAKESFDNKKVKLEEGKTKSNNNINTANTNFDSEINEINKKQKEELEKIENEKNDFNSKYGENPIKESEFNEKKNEINKKYSELTSKAEENRDNIINSENEKTSALEKELEEAGKELEEATKDREIADADSNNGYGKSIKDLNLEIKHIEHEIHKAGNEIANDYANMLTSNFNRTANVFRLSFGGTDKAADFVRLGMKTNKIDTHGKFDAGNSSHGSENKNNNHGTPKEAEHGGHDSGHEKH